MEMLAIASWQFVFSTVPCSNFVFCLVLTLYVPCLPTFGVLTRELSVRWMAEVKLWVRVTLPFVSLVAVK